MIHREDPRNLADPPGTPLTDVPTRVTLLTLCGCSDTFIHGNRASLGPLFARAMHAASPPSLIARDGPLPEVKYRTFKFHHFEGGDRSHWVYEEVPT